MGLLVDGQPGQQSFNDEFVGAVVGAWQRRDEMLKGAKELQEMARKRFSIDRIMRQWDEVFSG